MSVDLFSPGTIAAILITLVFAMLCYASMPRAIYLYTVLGCVPYAGLVRLTGSRISDGLRLVELLATAMIGVWWLRWELSGRSPIIRTPFNRSLTYLVPFACVSLISGFIWIDPTVSRANVKLSVALGQIMLLVWPIGTYFVVANSITSARWVRAIRRAIIVMALPSAFYPFATNPGQWDWTMPFSLAAAPLCFAELFEARTLLRRIPLAFMSVLPIVAGITIGKAHWYLAGATSLLIVAFVRARRSLIVLVPFLIALYAIGAYLTTGDPIPGEIRALVAHEEQQGSLGGGSGRAQLTLDAIRIWATHPLLGVGPGNMWPYMHRYSNLDTAHNQFANILLEQGLVGALLVAGFLWGALRTGVRLLRASRVTFNRTFVIGWMGLFAGSVIGGITGDVIFPSVRNGGLLTLTYAYLQWVVLGLVVSLARIEYRDRLAGRTMAPPFGPA